MKKSKLVLPLGMAFLIGILLFNFQNCSSSSGGGGAADANQKNTEISLLNNLKAIAAGEDSACALKTDGTIWCWGDNHYGQLGTKVGSSLYSENAVKVSGISTAVGVSVGTYFACASLSSGKVLCWGSGAAGKLGNGAQADSTAPVEVSGISTATSSIAAGSTHACVVLTSGVVKCWGGGPLGNGTLLGTDSCNVPNDCSLTPVTVSGITTAKKVTVGYYTSCALLADTSVVCWGLNGEGDLGNGNITSQSSPSSTVTTNILQISMGMHFHSCGVNSTQQVQCWGFNRYGELGTGSAGGPQTCNSSFGCSKTAVTVSGVNTATMVAAGYSFSCAVLSDQTVKCWGINDNGELANGQSSGPDNCGSNKCSLAPLPVVGLTDAKAIAAGNGFACALTVTQTAKCWGSVGNNTISSPTDLNQNPNTEDLPLPGGGLNGGPTTPYRLVIAKLPRRKNGPVADAGNGTIISSPTGVSCVNCFTTSAIESGTVNLNSTLNVGTVSIEWSGDCTSKTVIMDTDKYCNFYYDDGSQTLLAGSSTIYTLRVSKTGGGTGTVTSIPAGINCTTACTTITTQAAYGTGVTSFSLTATANVGSTFVGWAGDCVGAASTTSVALNFNRHCVAVFATP